MPDSRCPPSVQCRSQQWKANDAGAASPPFLALAPSAVDAARSLKVPRPARMLAVFESVLQGLRDRVRLTEEAEHKETQLAEEDALNSSTSSSTHSESLKVKFTNTNKDSQLACMLSEVENLLERYTIQGRMREAAARMSEAYMASECSSRKSSMAGLQRSFKECSKEMCAIEGQMDIALGQVRCKIIGVTGFARVMPGDIYETVVHIGNKKWKSRGRVGKDGVQKWSKSDRTFNIRAGYVLRVKVFECKLLGRQLLGERHCNILGLISATPQILTIDASSAGTVKLNMEATWDPLAHITAEQRSPDEAHDLLKVSTSQDTHRQLSASASLNGPEQHSWVRGRISSPAGWRRPAKMADSIRSEVSLRPNLSGDPWPASAQEAISNLSVALQSCVDDDENIVIKSLEDMLPALTQNMNARKLRCSSCLGSRSSTTNGQMSGATGDQSCDFLNVEEECYKEALSTRYSTGLKGVLGHGSSVSQTGVSTEEGDSEAVSLRSTVASTTDSGVESNCTSAVNTKCPVSPQLSLASSSDSAGDDLDKVIMQHVVCCTYLLEKLQMQGLLHAERADCLSMLERQQSILCSLSSLRQRLSTRTDAAVFDLRQAMDDAKAPQPVQEFWMRAVNGHILYVTREQFTSAHERLCSGSMRNSLDARNGRSLTVMASQIIGSALFPSEVQFKLVVTLHQFVDFMSHMGYYSIKDYAADVAAELWLLDSLKSGNSIIIVRAIHSLQDTVPADEVVRALLGLLASSKMDLASSNAAASYFESMGRSAEERDILSAMVSSSLADPRTDVRCGACLALSKLQCLEAIDRLTYVSENDVSSKVQAEARRAISVTKPGHFGSSRL